ncbi:hypothetical protein D3C84_976600 [compost metagenome]
MRLTALGADEIDGMAGVGQHPVRMRDLGQIETAGRGVGGAGRPLAVVAGQDEKNTLGHQKLLQANRAHRRTPPTEACAWQRGKLGSSFW